MDSRAKKRGFRINRFSFGGTAGVVACVALVAAELIGGWIPALLPIGP